MQTNNYIVKDIKALKLTNTIADAKKVFNQQIVTHIPVVENGNLYGLIAESELLSFDDDSSVLESIQHLFQSFFVEKSTNWLDLIKSFASNGANIIPVLNEDKKYIGYYELADILHFFSNTPFLMENGTMLVLSKHKNDYSLSEIAQIAESNDVKLLGAFVSSMENDALEVTIKISGKNVNDVIHSFRRYGYRIVLGIEEDEYLNDLKDRSEYLQKYLNI